MKTAFYFSDRNRFIMKEDMKDFPNGVRFDALNQDWEATPDKWGVFGVHDPSMIEADGYYYVFSTGTFRRDLYQIRRSKDLIHWEFVGEAFTGFDELKPVVGTLKKIYGGDVRTENLWAPDVVPAYGGGYWLYGCYTGVFGNNYSVIYLAHADGIEGPYRYVEMLVVTGGNWGLAPNAIDPQIFYDGAGRMWMTYGSFYGGIRILELDPATGLRKDGFTFDMFEKREIGREEYYGRRILTTTNAEGSVVAYHPGVPVYTGDIFAEAENPARWEKKDLFYLMCSADSLSMDYNMRVWASESPDGGYMQCPYGRAGQKVASSFSWRYGEDDLRVSFDFYVPGHNDLYTTRNGVDLVVYHNRTPYTSQRIPRRHYLFISMYARNAKGELVMSPNRYAGEKMRKIAREELAGREFDYIQLGSGNFDCAFAKPGIRLEEDGSLTLKGEKLGQWKLYGEYYVAFTFDGLQYFGAAMPAWIEAENGPGITVTARGEDGLSFFLNSKN